MEMPANAAKSRHVQHNIGATDEQREMCWIAFMPPVNARKRWPMSNQILLIVVPMACRQATIA
jgi:hypothetical protein